MTQITVDDSIPDLCGKTFVLEPYGSCTLELAISGPVSSDCGSSDNPCLFVCMSDGFTCAGTKHPLEVKTAAFPVAGGVYYPTDAGSTPMLAAMTSSSGDKWDFSIDVNGPLPSDLADGVFIGTDCTGNACLAVGGYLGSENYSNVYPMIAVSQKGGAKNSWSYAIDSADVPSDYVGFGFFSNIDCSGEICVASGQYETETNTYPLLAVSTKSGATGSWTYETSPYPNGIFNSVSCDGDLCIVGGQYGNGSTLYPLLLVNTDISGGGTWEPVIDSTHDTLPSDFANNGILFSVACSGQTCIAGGQYENSGANSGYYPLLVMSSNVENGDWDYVISSTGLPEDGVANGDNEFNFIKGTSCSGGICLAGGNYVTNANNYPILLVNTNASTSDTWTPVVTSDEDSLPTAYGTNGAFFAVSCSGEICAAAGGYEDDGGIDAPILYVNIAVESGTWSYAVDDSNNLPDKFSQGGSFYGVTCNAVMCMAEGYYADNESVPNYYGMVAVNMAISTDEDNEHWQYPIDINNVPSDYGTDGNGFGLFCGTTYPVCNNSYF